MLPTNALKSHRHASDYIARFVTLQDLSDLKSRVFACDRLSKVVSVRPILQPPKPKVLK